MYENFIVYYIVKENKIIDIILNNKDKAEDTLEELKKQHSEKKWLPSQIIELKPSSSNKLNNGLNDVYTISLNEELLYCIINNEFTAKYIYKHLTDKSKEDEYPREYKIYKNKVEYTINNKTNKFDELKEGVR